MVQGTLPLLAGVLVFGSEKCPLKAPVPQGGAGIQSWGTLTPRLHCLFYFTVYHVCGAVCTR